MPITAFIFTLAIIILIIIDFPKNAENELTKYYLIIAISAVLIILIAISILRNPSYFYFNDDDDEKLVIRYYPVSFLNKGKNSIEIPKKRFIKYETKKFFFGTQEKLIIYVNFRNKVAKYPPISLSAVNKADREKLKVILSNYSRKI